MLQSQFQKLKNITTESSYRYNTIYLNEQKIAHFKNRSQQIVNEFDLVDFNKKGYLFRGQIQQYLQKKYQWVNKDILNELFNTMDWKRKDMHGDMYVQKGQFCSQYIKRQKQLFYEYNRLQSEQQWFSSLYSIFQSTLHMRPSYYVSVQLLKVQLYNVQEQFLNVDIRYQDHQQKLQFDINENSYDPTKPSYELILPAQENQFFLSYNFTNVRNHALNYGNTYVKIDLKQNDKILKEQELNLEIRKNGAIVGRTRVFVSLQTNVEVIKEKLKEKEIKVRQNLKEKKGLNLTLSELKRKEYEYLQFLWGVKHVPPAKIQDQDVTLIIVLRTILIVLLGGLGIVVHVLGRCEPLSLIAVFMLLKWRTYVILKSQIFLIAWLIIAAMLLDGIWLVFSSHHVSQINYLNLHSAMTFTYFLLGSKVLFFIYLLAFEKPFQKDQEKNNFAQNNVLN